MLINKVILNDFGVYLGRNEFNFQTTKERPIILIGGGNGAGKTTLFESVMICLYGQNSFEQKITQKKYHQLILRLIHRHLGTKSSADQMSVMVEFQYAHDGKITEYQITRHWLNNGGEVEERLYVKKRSLGDESFNRLDSFGESEWQVFIDQLLPRGIIKLFFFDGEKIQNIAENGDENSYIKLSFDTLLGLDLVNQLIQDIGISVLRNSDGETKKILSDIDSKNKEKSESEQRVDSIIIRQADIKNQLYGLQRELAVQREKFERLGGDFAEKQELLITDKARLESELDTVQNEIRKLCNTSLPFTLIPKDMRDLKDEIIQEQQKIHDRYAKEILEKTLEEFSRKIKSELLWPNLDSKTRQSIRKDIQNLFDERLKDIPNELEPSYDLSGREMEQIVLMVDNLDKIEKNMKDVARSHDILKNALRVNKTSLDSAPKSDEIDPILGKLTSTSHQIGELENELNNLETSKSQERSLIVLLNAKIRTSLAKKYADRKRLMGVELAPKVQDVLEDYSCILRKQKLELLARCILEWLGILLHKKSFIDKVVIDQETFEIKLYKENDQITKEMLSKGELQMYSTAIVMGLARTSGRPLPIMIDTPLARLDEAHRKNCVEEFYPYVSHQTIIFSTDSEIDSQYYEELQPYISKTFTIQYDSAKGKTIIQENRFFDKENERIVKIQ